MKCERKIVKDVLPSEFVILFKVVEKSLFISQKEVIFQMVMNDIILKFDVLKLFLTFLSSVRITTTKRGRVFFF